MTISCTPVILCREPLDNTGRPVCLREVCGVSVINILNVRLKAIRRIKRPILLMSSNEPHTKRAAQSLGWITVSRNRRSLGDLVALFHLCASRYIALMDIRFPIIDPEIWSDMISKMDREGLSYLFVKNYCGFSPIAIIRKDTAVLAGIKKVFSKTKGGWLDNVKDLAQRARIEGTSIKKPIISDCLRADTMDSEIIRRLGGTEINLKSLEKKESDEGFDRKGLLEISRDRLYQAMQDSRFPHKSNTKLVNFESRNGLDIVRSFPQDVAITITDKCNANCLFCNYEPGSHNRENRFLLEDIRKMTWLRYVTKLGVGGGVGEPLAHPEFLSIFRYLKNTYPHLVLRIITNGILLNRELCREFAGNLARIRISLNAATKTTWEKLMRTRGFERVCRSVSELSKLKSEMNTDKPEIILLMTVSRQNIHEAVPFVELAERLGAQAVSYSFFSKSVMKRCDMAQEESMYFDMSQSDRLLDQAAKRAETLGIEVFDRPLPFRKKRGDIFQGERVNSGPEKCYLPWQTCYLAGSREVEDRACMNFCCAGVETGIEYDHASLAEDTFERLWNHPYIQAVRRLVNDQSATHPLCRFCRTVDQADPANYRTDTEDRLFQTK